MCGQWTKAPDDTGRRTFQSVVMRILSSDFSLSERHVREGAANSWHNLRSRHCASNWKHETKQSWWLSQEHHQKKKTKKQSGETFCHLTSHIGRLQTSPCRAQCRPGLRMRSSRRWNWACGDKARSHHTQSAVKRSNRSISSADEKHVGEAGVAHAGGFGVGPNGLVCNWAHRSGKEAERVLHPTEKQMLGEVQEKVETKSQCKWFKILRFIKQKKKKPRK